jgi:hypothetical protein
MVIMQKRRACFDCKILDRTHPHKKRFGRASGTERSYEPASLH